MSGTELRYLSYLLRLWQTRKDEQVIWQLSLESPHSGERLGFVDLGALCRFLRQQMRETPAGEWERMGPAL